VTGLIRAGKASLTEIGRNMVVSVSPKHAIKRVDRPGRSLPVYEEVHPKSKEGNRRVHDRFLQSLKVVTSGTRPILVADAGFRTPFFWACASAGFDFATFAIPDTPAHRRYGGPPPHELFCVDCGDRFARYGWLPVE
jgi:hypothetical protein